MNEKKNEQIKKKPPDPIPLVSKRMKQHREDKKKRINLRLIYMFQYINFVAIKKYNQKNVIILQVNGNRNVN